MPKRNIVLLFVACLVSLVALAARERSGHGRRFGEVLAAIERSYYEPVDGDQLYIAAVEAAVGKLDEHSAYLRDAGRAELESALDQEFGGVGLELALDSASGLPIVVSPVMNSPAWRAGVAAGDRIEAVDGQPVVGLPLRQIVDRLRGPIGEAVTLTARAAASPLAGSRRPRVETITPSSRNWSQTSTDACRRPPGLPRRSSTSPRRFSSAAIASRAAASSAAVRSPKLPIRR